MDLSDVQNVDTVGRFPTSYLFAGPVCLWYLVALLEVVYLADQSGFPHSLCTLGSCNSKKLLTIFLTKKTKKLLELWCICKNSLVFLLLLQRNHNNSLKMDNFMIIILSTDVQHKIIHKRFSLKREILLMLSKFVDNWTPSVWKIIYHPNHCILITNRQQKVYFTCLFLICWKSEKLNLKLLNLVF